eukprot:g1334.t1
MFLLFCLLFSIYIYSLDACTTFAVGKKATQDGSVLISQSSDGDGQDDFRLVSVPTYTRRSTRNIYFAAENFPRYVGPDRGGSASDSPYNVNRESNRQFNASVPIGTIKSEPGTQTFQYLEGSYGHLNEYGLTIGESSCSANICAEPISNGTTESKQNGKALLSIDELTRIAMESCRTARCAIQTMGSLAETYGFYGASNNLEEMPNECGESLVIGDAITQEAWVFHILPNFGGGAIWVAQRVHDEEIAVVANMFTIRDVPIIESSIEEEERMFLYSLSLLPAAKKLGWPGKESSIDFTFYFSAGEYYNRYYSGRRIWRAQSILAPSLDISPYYNNTLEKVPIYPFSFKPDKRITVADIRKLYRDQYQGTEFDLSQGLASGPWNLPVRFDPEQAYDGKIKGAWERPIGVFRTTYTLIGQLRTEGKTALHFAPHTALGSCFLPIFSTAIGKMFPMRSLSYSDVLSIDRLSQHWASRYTLNIAYLRFRDMHPMIQAAQRYWENKTDALVEEYFRNEVSTAVGSSIDTRAVELAKMVTARWFKLADELILQWSDGFNFSWYGTDEQNYPTWWLQAVGYQNGPRGPH